MRLQGNILGQAWMLDRDFILSNMSQIIPFLKGEGSGSFALNTTNKDDEKPSNYLYDYDNNQKVRNYRLKDASANSKMVGVMNIDHVLTKHNMECGPVGMVAMRDRLLEWKNDNRVVSAVLRMDCPGGSAVYSKLFAEAVRDFGKPIFVSFSGLMASAAYYIGAGASAIYAEEGTDRVGSIGTMASWADFQAFMESQGVKFHEVYAEQSKQKNSIMKLAYEGNYDLLKSEILNPYAAAFINFVKSVRTITDSAAYEGATYNADKAVGIGMIDGVKTFEDVMAMAIEQGEAYQIEHNNANNQISMSDKKVSFSDKIKAMFGFEPTMGADGKIEMTEEQFGLVVDKFENQDVNALTERVKAIEGSDAMTKLEARLIQLEEKVAIISNEEAEDVTNTATDGQEKPIGAESQQKSASDNVFDKYEIEIEEF